ncbi:hypothetical protein WMY93_033423, partial [Mugilogobius chulae]
MSPSLMRVLLLHSVHLMQLCLIPLKSVPLGRVKPLALDCKALTMKELALEARHLGFGKQPITACIQAHGSSGPGVILAEGLSCLLASTVPELTWRAISTEHRDRRVRGCVHFGLVSVFARCALRGTVQGSGLDCAKTA